MCVLNVHIWLIVDRLSQFETKRAKNLSMLFIKMFNAYVEELLSSLNLKKSANIKKTYKDFLEVGRKNLSMHFHGYE